MLYSLHSIKNDVIKPLNKGKLSVRMGHKAKGPANSKQAASYQWARCNVHPFCGKQ